MKKVLNFLGVFFSLSVIGLSQYCYWRVVQDQRNWLCILACSVFYLFSFLAVWSLLTTNLIDPGYVPRGYRYEMEKINKTDLTLYQYTLLAKEQKIIDQPPNTQNFKELRQMGQKLNYTVELPIDDSIYGVPVVQSKDIEQQKVIVYKQQVEFFQQDDFEDAFENGHTESLHSDFAGSFNYKYSLDKDGKPTLQSKISIRNNQENQPTSIRKVSFATPVKSPRLFNFESIPEENEQSDSQLVLDISDVMQPLVTKSQKTAINSSDVSLLEFEKHASASEQFSQHDRNGVLSVQPNLNNQSIQETTFFQTGSLYQSHKEILSSSKGLKSPAGIQKIEYKMSVNLSLDELEALSKKYLLICKICDCAKPPRVHHCSQCNRCCVRMDHHCPWVGNCVGLRNQKAFILFTLYVQLMCFVYFTTFAIKMIICLVKDQDFWDYGSPDDFINFVLQAACCFLSVFFGLFTFAMFFDQIRLIHTDSSTIDNMKQIRSKAAAHTLMNKMPQAQNKTFRQKLQDSLGSKSILAWLIPITGFSSVCIEDELSLASN